MNSGTTFEEIKRLFDYLEENKTNNDLQIILTTEGCHDLYKLFIDCNQYQKILEERINEAIEYIEKHKQIAMFADLRKEGTHQYTIECDADDLLSILRGEDNENN